jgi:hypothetical protein
LRYKQQNIGNRISGAGIKITAGTAPVSLQDFLASPLPFSNS